MELHDVSLPWFVVGVAGAVSSLALPWFQTRTYRRARALDFDESRYGTTPDTVFRVPITPLKVYAEPVAARAVGLPLGVAGAVLFLVFGLWPSMLTWSVCGGVTILLTPVRRALGLRVTHRIARDVQFRNGPLRDRDGAVIAEQSWAQVVRTWYRHEYRDRPPGEDDLSVAVLGKFWWLAGHLLCWPITLPGTQIVQTAMCQNPAWSLGHVGDDAGAPWLADLGEARTPVQRDASGKARLTAPDG
ncbi:hypothetical protein [Embleya sp. NPDC020630]|uniref:hypothetical protein n=1 Tax=Embleya sp. NPDC020630 TaxID=3363979 RepID=UPI0037AE287A